MKNGAKTNLVRWGNSYQMVPQKEAWERARAIEALGMPPENGERYAATTGELVMWARVETEGK